ncbi:hypothetical protein PYCCODRAFT_1463363 [Trametes coccinea BRFM310]|uniref:Uncharacterized protein n=1 Tax=Trametes coccinea (strain BRFM310) TaxID=1353009 RepID=A0A1Y2J3Y5_TRAC3|nr:hypothetical protein PYCCODRAFT_1463352 [Trametes coccinea BRFM310]OSD08128.1 hypothetical protein PYCCODRAFT_1463363 [Trametes coccinea BRFM310]
MEYHYVTIRARLDALTTVQGRIGAALNELQNSHASLAEEISRLEAYLYRLATSGKFQDEAQKITPRRVLRKWARGVRNLRRPSSSGED